MSQWRVRNDWRAPRSSCASRARAARGCGPCDCDAHVPVIFYGPAFRAGRYTQFARVVEMAPTVARVIHVVPTERIDGRVLEAALTKGSP